MAVVQRGFLTDGVLRLSFEIRSTENEFCLF